MLSNRGLGIKAKKCLCEGVIVWSRGMGYERSAERRKVNVLEMKCFTSLAGVSRMDRVRNKEASKRAGIVRKLGSRADQRVSRCGKNG